MPSNHGLGFQICLRAILKGKIIGFDKLFRYFLNWG